MNAPITVSNPRLVVGTGRQADKRQAAGRCAVCAGIAGAIVAFIGAAGIYAVTRWGDQQCAASIERINYYGQSGYWTTYSRCDVTGWADGWEITP